MATRSKSTRKKKTSRLAYAVLGFSVLVTIVPSLLALHLFEVSDNEHEQERASVSVSLPSSSEAQSLPRLLEACSSSIDSNQGDCCAPWSWNTDKWWAKHYQWTLSTQNMTHTCFRRITDAAHLTFLESLVKVQQQCDYQVQLSQISSGYAAALSAVARSFYASYTAQHSFQITLAHDRANWNFSPKNSSHWAHCPTRDMNCFYLPISPCQAQLGRNDAPRGQKLQIKGQFAWLRQYAFRVRHNVRYHVQDYLERQPARIQTFRQQKSMNCTVIHVRRGDIAFGKGRRYAAVDEYLEAGQVKPGDTVVLLTDDVSAVEEVEKYLRDDQDWIYLDRPRTRATALGFEGFIPSKDPALEILAILAELELASHCNRLVHGKSGFVAVIAEAMGPDTELVYLQIQLDKKQQPKLDPAVRAQNYLKAIEERLAAKQKKRSGSVTTSDR